MKLLSVSYARMCGFVGGSLDLRDVPPGLVTLSGPNWNGKTTLLELPLAAFYREWASRTNNDIAGWADSRDSMVSAEFSIGPDVYRTRVTIDGTTRKSQALLQIQTSTGGWKSLTDGKVSTFDAAMAELVPPKSALLSSQFAAQNRAGSLTAASRSQRKDLFIHFLWLERLIAMGETAKTCAEAVQTALVALRTAQSTLRQSATDDALAAALEAQDAAEHDLTRDRERLAELELVVAGLEASRSDLLEAAERHASAQAQLLTWRSRKIAAEARLAAIPSARLKASELRRALVDRATEKSARDVATLERKREALDALSHDKEAIGQAVVELTDITQAVGSLRAELDARQSSLPDILRRRDAEKALAALAGVPCGGPDVFPTCRFLQDAVEAKKLAGGVEPQHYANEARLVEISIEEARAQVKALELRANRVKPVAGKAAALSVTQERLAELAEQQGDLARDLVNIIDETNVQMQATLSELDAVVEVAHREIEGCDAAIAPLDALAEQTVNAKHEFAKIETTLREVRQDHAETSARAIKAQSMVERWDAEVNRLLAQREKAEALTPRITQAERDARVQGFLAKALHRDGLPTLEIATAAPAISQLTTDLLDHSGFGSRFRVTVTTLVPTADGKGWKEDFAIRVFDNDRGKEIADVGDLSGGERIMVEEALRAALTIYMSARHEHPVKTCWRDETTGPLDKENRPRYIAMLRRLRELGGYDHVLYVSHADDAVAAADTIFDVSMGAATRRT